MNLFSKISLLGKWGVAIILILFFAQTGMAQSYDSLLYSSDSSKTYKATVVPYGDQLLIYRTPRPFAFVTGIPKNIALAGKESFSKKALPAWGLIIGSTLALLPAAWKAMTDCAACSPSRAASR